VCKYACLVFGSHTLCTLAHIMNMFAVTLSGEHEKSGAQKKILKTGRATVRDLIGN